MTPRPTNWLLRSGLARRLTVGPDEFEIGRRTAEFWQPLHDRIQSELARLRHRFGRAVLFDAHSIRSTVPRLFAAAHEGRLDAHAKLVEALSERMPGQSLAEFHLSTILVGCGLMRQGLEHLEHAMRFEPGDSVEQKLAKLEDNLRVADPQITAELLEIDSTSRYGRLLWHVGK